MDILFKNATVITMDDARPVLEDAFVGIKGRKIEYVGSTEPEGEIKRVIDARGKVLMPGIINTHTHVPMTLFRGLSDDCELDVWLREHIWPAEDKLTPESVRAGTELAVAEMIASGTTSFSDSYFFVDAIADVALSSGIRANLSRSIVGDGENFDVMPSVSEAKELFSRIHMADGGRLRADASIHAEYTSETKCRQRVAEMARERGQILQIHTSESRSEHENCIAKYGKTPTEQFLAEGLFEGTRPLLAHCCYITENDMEIIKSAGGSVAHCPVSNLKLASGIAPVPAMLNKGVNVGLATDGVASNNSTDMFEEIKLAAVLHKGISENPTAVNAYTALRMATVNGALAQGRNDCGRIKEGFDADVIMLDFDRPHLIPCHNVVSNAVYAARGSDVVMTMVAGKVLYENGVFTTIDIERAKASIKA
ncbi:MAG: amidohydrolase [Oscillospiraceae bacterium]|nr:amidohydrolase [Oscillospiraceae bacterium]